MYLSSFPVNLFLDCHCFIERFLFHQGAGKDLLVVTYVAGQLLLLELLMPFLIFLSWLIILQEICKDKAQHRWWSGSKPQRSTFPGLGGKGDVENMKIASLNWWFDAFNLILHYSVIKKNYYLLGEFPLIFVAILLRFDWPR